MDSRKKSKLRIACLQLNAGENPAANLLSVSRLLKKVKAHSLDLVALPENFLSRCSASELPNLAYPWHARALAYFSSWASQHKTSILLGSLIEPASKKGKYFNTSYLISAQGKTMAKYRKIHLFDSNVGGAKTRESRHILSGHQVVIGKVRDVIVGLTVCYDLRFPELFRKLTLKGAKIIFVPSNFTWKTGKAHWEILLRARAIENQVFIVAPAQYGCHPSSGIRSYGNSLVIDPWGKVLAQGSQDKDELLTLDLDIQYLMKIRKALPCLEHRKLA
ncbi:MAG: carbon-nitrogen hydrolase family protein [Candidatus Omnitrophica bacterium]|nr:carbon-nitrogen hydrolase family protein [Candidatus Omnitrophota bacterium]